MRSCLMLLFFLSLSAFAFPQSMGTIQCPPGSTAPVPAFSAPGKPHVVEQLKCGQSVRVLGTGESDSPLAYTMGPREYAILQINDNVAYVDAQYVKVSESKEPLKAKSAEPAPLPSKNTTKEDVEQQKWGLITKDSIKLRDERLLQPIILNGQTYTRTFKAILSNDSDLPVSQLQLLIRIYDCSDKINGIHSNCDIIGEAKIMAATSIPPHQMRRIETVATFDSIPSAKSKTSWNYQILGVRAE
jgi:hypothetical protein